MFPKVVFFWKKEVKINEAKQKATNNNFLLKHIYIIKNNKV